MGNRCSKPPSEKRNVAFPVCMKKIASSRGGGNLFPFLSTAILPARRRDEGLDPTEWP